MPTWFLKLKQHSEIRGRKSIFKLEATRLFVGLCWRVGWLVEVNLMLVKLPAKNKNTRFNARSRWNECINFINTTNRWSDDILKNIDAISDFRYLIYITSQQEGSEFKFTSWTGPFGVEFACPLWSPPTVQRHAVCCPPPAYTLAL